jgi:hypothetical protein
MLGSNFQVAQPAAQLCFADPSGARPPLSCSHPSRPSDWSEVSRSSSGGSRVSSERLVLRFPSLSGCGVALQLLGFFRSHKVAWNSPPNRDGLSECKNPLTLPYGESGIWPEGGFEAGSMNNFRLMASVSEHFDTPPSLIRRLNLTWPFFFNSDAHFPELSSDSWIRGNSYHSASLRLYTSLDLAKIFVGFPPFGS